MVPRVHVSGRVLNLPSARPRLAPRGGRLIFLTAIILARNVHQGWNKDYNFGILDAMRIGWNPVIRAHADFISADQ
jgi:hypothetical protein